MSNDQIKRELDAIEAEVRDLGLDMTSLDELRERQYASMTYRELFRRWQVDVAQYVFFAEAHERGGYW